MNLKIASHLLSKIKKTILVLPCLGVQSKIVTKQLSDELLSGGDLSHFSPTKI